jgi:PPE-repeat protein
MLDFGALPPEINSGRMYAGPGAGPMLAAAVAWDVLAAELFSTAASYGSVITDLAAGWLGPSSISMAAAAMPYVSWITATAGQAEATGAQAKAAVAAYEAAFAMTVPPPVIAANRALLMALIATNFLGQNTPAIMATEAHYMEMWAQDASAMYGYAGASQAASTLAPFTPALLNTNPAGLGGQAGAVAQAAGTGAGTSAQMVSPFTSAMSMPVGTTMSTPLTAASAPNAVPGLASSASAMSSSSSTSPLSSLTTLTSSSTGLTSGTSLVSGMGSPASMGTSGMSMIGSAGALMRSVSPAASILGNQFQPLGSALGGWVGSGTGMFGSPGMGSAAVSAGVGRAASLGMLSVPQSWASAAPAFSSVAPTLSGVSGVGAAPAVGAGGPGSTLGGMPMLGNAMRGTGAPMAAKPKLGFRPAMVQHPVYAG